MRVLDSWRRGNQALTSLGSPLAPLRRSQKSVRGKLAAVVLLTTAIALLVAGTAMLSRDLGVYRKSWAADLASEAGFLALSTAPALAFDDHRLAERNLAALRARSAVLAAGLYDGRGKLYASYTRLGESVPALQPALTQEGPRISGETIEVSQPILQAGEMLGTLYIRARYDVTNRVNAYLGIFSLVMLMSMGVAFVLSTALRTAITHPLDEMADVARRLVDQRDYSLRVQKNSPDEIGLVVDAFNSMLDEVQSRTRALEQSNTALTREVEVRMSTEAALARANAQLENAMAAAEIGSWVWDLRSNKFTADRNLSALAGFTTADSFQGDPALLHRQIHPADLPAIVAAEKEALRTGNLQATEFRIVRPDGDTRWVAGRGKVHTDSGGAPTMLTGLLIDITAQKRAERALRESEQLYRAIGESIDYGIWVCDANGRNTYASESFLRLLGITQQQCSDLGWGDALHPDDVRDTIAAWNECVRSGGVWYREHRFRGADGRYHPILAQGVPLKAEDGTRAGWVGINLDISRLKYTEDALREADRRKDEFLATLAHELRNPLAPIRHAVRLLAASGVDESQRQWGRDVIARQVQRMALLLDDLLDVARITSGRLELRMEYVDLASLVESAVETVRPLLDAKQHTLKIELPAVAIQAKVDQLRLSQALSNLLTNAAKYSDAGGMIKVSISLEANHLKVAVKDSGIGLSAVALPKVFEMFSQVDSAIDRTEGGLGIGLALVKGLVSLHGGTVEAISEGLGRGSEFIMRLPLSLVLAPQAVVKAEARAVADTAGERRKVLIVDDNRDAAESLALLLQHLGHDVSVAHSGLEALDAGMRQRPEVVILDIGMPGMNGYEVAQRIRKQDWGRSALLLAVTGWGQEDDKQRARMAGFDRHLTKPVDPDSLAQLLNTSRNRPDPGVDHA